MPLRPSRRLTAGCGASIADVFKASGTMTFSKSPRGTPCTLTVDAELYFDPTSSMVQETLLAKDVRIEGFEGSCK